MKFSIQSISTSRFGIAMALVIGRFVPPRYGFRLSEQIARRIASRKTDSIVQAVRSNQWVVSGGKLTPEQLDQAVLDTFRHHTRCLYRYYRHLYNPSSSESFIEKTPLYTETIKNSQVNENPSIVVGIHMSNFDLVAYGAVRHGLKGFALALSEPTKGHEWQYKIRRKYGFEVVPASLSTIRQAERRLKQGETVLTGCDRPLNKSKYRPRFFGRPAALPVLHIHLALRTNVPVLVAAPMLDSDGIFRILASNPIYMDSYSNRNDAILKNAEKVLRVAEDFIRREPQQWVMFLPVWPEVQAEVP